LRNEFTQRQVRRVERRVERVRITLVEGLEERWDQVKVCEIFLVKVGFCDEFDFGLD
jgi:hypothetical protein